MAETLDILAILICMGRGARLDKTSTTASALRGTGINVLDQALENYLQRKVIDKYGRSLPVDRLRDPEIADGYCQTVAEDFAKTLQKQGLNASCEGQDDEEPPYSKAWGYDDRTREPGWGSHYLTVVRQGERMITIDWTAAQFGYEAFPLIQELVDNRWQRL